MFKLKLARIFGAIALVTITSYAQPPRGHNYGENGFGPGYGQHGMFEGLNLTEEQEVKLVRLKREMKPILESQREEMKIIRLKIRDELSREKVDRKKLTDLSRKMAELNFKKSEQMNDHLIKIREIVGLEKFKELGKRQQQRMENRTQKPHGKKWVR